MKNIWATDQTKMVKILLLLILLLGLSLSNGFSQGKVLDRDEKDALHLAKVFTQRIQKTKDLAPLIPELFTPNFTQNLFKVDSFAQQEWLTPEIASKMDSELVQRFHIGMFHFAYLGGILVYSKYSLDVLDKGSELALFPADVRKAILKEPYLGGMFSNKNKSEDTRVSTSAQLLHLTETLESIAIKFRKHLKQFPDVQTKKYKKNITQMSINLGAFFEPHTSDACIEKRCSFGLAESSKVIYVQIPPAYLLAMSRINGEMKILDAFVPSV